MRAWARPLLCACWLFAASACGAASIRLELGRPEPELSFLVAAKMGTELRPLGQTRTLDSITLEPDETLLYWIGLSDEALTQIAPGYVADRREQADLYLGPSAAISLDYFDDPLLLAVPPQAELLEIDVDSGRAVHRSLDQLPFFSSLRLRLPSEPEFCDPDPSARLVPFGAQGAIAVTSTAVTNSEMVDATLLDEHHLLVLGADVMFVLEEGGVMPTAKPGQRSPLLAGLDLAPPTYARRLAVDPTARADGSRTVWTVGWWESSGVLIGTLEVFSVNVEGIVRLPDPIFAPELPTHLPALNSVAVAPDGTVLVVGAAGTVLVRAPGETVFRRSVEPTGLLNVRVGDVSFTGPERTDATALLALDGFSVAEGDPISGRFTVFEVAPEISPLLAPSREGYGLARTPDGEYWVSADQGVLARSRVGGDWHGFDPGLPPSLRGCGGPTLRTQHSSLSGIAADERGAVYVVVNDCSAIMRIDRTRACVSPLRGPDGRDPAPANHHARVRVFGDRVFVLGGKLEIYVAR